MKQFLACAFLISTICGFSQQNKIDIDISSFTKPAENPIIRADSSYTFLDPFKNEMVRWQRADVFNPAAIVKNNKVYLLLRCEDNPAAAIGGRTSRIGIAESDDGIHFKKFPTPVLFPRKDGFEKFDYPGGCEDPRIVESEEGAYVVVYTAWNGKKASLSAALSKDLFHWQKKGPVFAKAYKGKFTGIWTKSGSIITKMQDNKIVAAKINGKYWMYWGEHFINLAWSENLYDWYPLVDENGELKKIVETRPHQFDSDLTECGPPAIITSRGIELFYNGKNATDEKADPSLAKGMYSVGYVIFDPNDPSKVIDRSDSCFLKPTLPHEIKGQYAAGTTFSEGLVFFQNKWFLYYGTADSFVGVAVADAK
jgi:beta-1,2-mannosidase